MFHHPGDAFENAVAQLAIPAEPVARPAPRYRRLRLAFAVVSGLAIGGALGLFVSVVTGILPILC